MGPLSNQGTMEQGGTNDTNSRGLSPITIYVHVHDYMIGGFGGMLPRAYIEVQSSLKMHS